jgi:hypothetical protein
MDADLENQPGPPDEFDQSSDNSDSPPLVSAMQLKRERTVEKARHTKLITKINLHIAGLGSKRELAVHRASLTDQLEECTAAHERYIKAPDFNAKKNEDPNDWIRKCEAKTMEIYGQIDRYIRTPRSSIHSSVGDKAAFNSTLTKQPENPDSIVGSSVSKSKASQRPDSAAIISEMQQRLHQEAELRRSVEEQLSKATITLTQMTLDSVRISSEIERNAELQRKFQQQADQMAKEKRDSDEAELQYRTLVEKEKRETNEKHERGLWMPSTPESNS